MTGLHGVTGRKIIQQPDPGEPSAIAASTKQRRFRLAARPTQTLASLVDGMMFCDPLRLLTTRRSALRW